MMGKVFLNLIQLAKNFNRLILTPRLPTLYCLQFRFQDDGLTFSTNIIEVDINKWAPHFVEA